jgi:hypothetical protein
MTETATQPRGKAATGDASVPMPPDCSLVARNDQSFRLKPRHACLLFVAGLLVATGLLKLYDDPVKSAIRDNPWSVALVAVGIFLWGVVTISAAEKLKDVTNPVMALIVLGLVPSVYSQIREGAQERDARRAQITKVTEAITALRSEIVLFAVRCSPAANNVPPELVPDQSDPRASNQNLPLFPPSCEARFEQMLKHWIAATWTLRPMIPGPEIHSAAAAITSCKDVRLPVGSSSPKNGLKPDEQTEVAKKILACESTDVPTRCFRRLANAFVASQTDKTKSADFGRALIDFYHLTRRFGCAVVVANRTPHDALSAGQSCSRYIEAAHRMYATEGFKDLAMVSAENNIAMEAIVSSAQISEPEALELATWWRVSEPSVCNP